jgi:hypothetical protein
MGKGLKRGTSDYDCVKQQIISGQWDVSGKLPHRAILDFNIEVENWPESKYEAVCPILDFCQVASQRVAYQWQDSFSRRNRRTR